MNRRAFPAGTTSSALLKALLRHIEAQKGLGEAETWLQRVNIPRVEVEDETRTIALATLHRALQFFAERCGRDAIAETWRYLVEPNHLGAWVRVVRGTNSPTEAFARFGSSESEYGRTTRWETLEAGDGVWRGRMHIAHDAMLESDGLLSLGRMAELSAVPALFGFGRAQSVTCKPVSTKAGLHQEFEVRWRVPSSFPSVAVGVGMGALLGLVPGLVGWIPAHAGGTGVFVGLVLGAFGGHVSARDRLRRAESHAQAVRVHALERSMVLKEDRERVAGGQVEGMVIAGQYRVRARMGSGASGVIYEAERISDGMPVAIKLLRAAAAHDAVASDRLRREAEALGLAWHPNVVEVLDHGLLPDGTSYLVMELLRGETLATRLRTRGQLASDEVLRLAEQVCDALAAVHAAGVIHRDLKPSNIFLADDPEGPGGERVKLLDFGIARVEWEETRITNMGSPLGTPGYMAPEQEMGGVVDSRSDLFALGATLYECLVGDPPPPLAPSGITKTNPEERPVVSKPVGLRFDWSTPRVKAVVSVPWRDVLAKAMALEPEDRFPDARSFRQALGSIDESTPPHVSQSS